jgi:hypothetical protein
MKLFDVCEELIKDMSLKAKLVHASRTYLISYNGCAIIFDDNEQAVNLNGNNLKGNWEIIKPSISAKEAIDCLLKGNAIMVETNGVKRTFGGNSSSKTISIDDIKNGTWYIV